MPINMDDEMFLHLTEYCNSSDNPIDNARRAEMLGFGGRKILIAPGAIIRIPNQENIGSNVFIGLYTYVNGDVTIGNNVLIGPHCSLAAGNHKFDPATGWFSARTNPDGDDSIVIGDGCWLASKVTVTGGVKMGRANLICAGAVVTKSTPDYAIMAGIPAKQIGEINPKTGEYIWYHQQKEKNS
ncbi:MAG: acyltransferase [Clostridia bacterium]|nr:acyltransferase [Clostridia bacterium]